jgi:hypothetical protein
VARSGAGLAAAVSIHGGLAATRPAGPGAIKARVLACHGALDPHVPMADAARFAEEIDHAGADWQLIIYGQAIHGFTHQHAVAGAARASPTPEPRRAVLAGFRPRSVPRIQPLRIGQHVIRRLTNRSSDSASMRGSEHRRPFWRWRVRTRWAWDLRLYLSRLRPHLMGADPERRRWHDQD